jgi:hypothetical protein
MRTSAAFQQKTGGNVMITGTATWRAEVSRWRKLQEKPEVNIDRQKVLRQMSEDVTTEDLVMIHEFFPHLMKCALHELLNPEVVQ